jgi:hypothetical protein
VANLSGVVTLGALKFMNRNRYVSAWWSLMLLGTLVFERVGSVPVLSVMLIWFSSLLITASTVRWSWILAWTWFLAVMFQVPWWGSLLMVGGVTASLGLLRSFANPTGRLLLVTAGVTALWWWVLGLPFHLSTSLGLILSWVGVVILSRPAAQVLAKDTVRAKDSNFLTDWISQEVRWPG